MVRVKGFQNKSQKLLWVRYAPIKVEVFYWKWMRREVLVKEELVKRGLLSAKLVICGIGGSLVFKM